VHHFVGVLTCAFRPRHRCSIEQVPNWIDDYNSVAPHSALSTQHSALSTQHSALGYRERWSITLTNEPAGQLGDQRCRAKRAHCALLDLSHETGRRAQYRREALESLTVAFDATVPMTTV
jgi:hypothetical protein